MSNQLIQPSQQLVQGNTISLESRKSTLAHSTFREVMDSTKVKDIDKADSTPSNIESKKIESNKQPSKPEIKTKSNGSKSENSKTKNNEVPRATNSNDQTKTRTVEETDTLIEEISNAIDLELNITEISDSKNVEENINLDSDSDIISDDTKVSSEIILRNPDLSVDPKPSIEQMEPEVVLEASSPMDSVAQATDKKEEDKDKVSSTIIAKSESDRAVDIQMLNYNEHFIKERTDSFDRSTQDLDSDYDGGALVERFKLINSLTSVSTDTEISPVDEKPISVADDSKRALLDSLSAGVSPVSKPESSSSSPVPRFVLHSQLSNPAQYNRWGKELGQNLMVMLNRNLDRVQMQLHPAHLGAIEVNLKIDRKRVVRLQFAASSEFARDALRANMDDLVRLFAARGLDLERPEVFDPSDESSRDFDFDRRPDGSFFGSSSSGVSESEVESLVSDVLDSELERRDLVNTFA